MYSVVLFLWNKFGKKPLLFKKGKLTDIGKDGKSRYRLVMRALNCAVFFIYQEKHSPKKQKKSTSSIQALNIGFIHLNKYLCTHTNWDRYCNIF